ncbi:energy transducer TonB [uncultured Flavobacterium sp.]|uniref:energy transducer TonB n=1 Tax=uncultured Flavobacterium sp. TaxID=165435 RepID=UPI0030ECE254
MKNVFLITLLFITSISFSQKDTIYKNVFFHNDTMKKYSKASYSSTIKEVIKNEFAKEYKTNEGYIKFNNSSITFTIIITAEGKVEIYEVDKESVFITNLLEKTFNKLPQIKPYVNNNGYIENYIATMTFKLYSEYVMVEKSNEPKEKTKINIIEKIPSFKNCKVKEDNELMKKCFMEKMNNHIKKHFAYPTLARENNIQGRIQIFFIIEKDGTIEDITVFDGHPLLHKSGLDIIQKMPTLNPGEQNGKKIRVSYLQPILYKIF